MTQPPEDPEDEEQEPEPPSRGSIAVFWSPDDPGLVVGRVEAVYGDAPGRVTVQIRTPDVFGSALRFLPLQHWIPGADPGLISALRREDQAGTLPAPGLGPLHERGLPPANEAEAEKRRIVAAQQRLYRARRRAEKAQRAGSPAPPADR